MLKYNNIIVKLTDSQKIRILTNINELSDKEMKILGVPSVNVGNMKDYLRDVYPHASSLSHAWNEELWSSVASDILGNMSLSRVNLAIAPGAKVKLSPYRREISEDPRLASAMSSSFLGAATRAKIATAPSGYYIAEADTAFMDDEPNGRVINELVTKPYLDSMNAGGAKAVIADNRVPSEKYRNVNTDIQRLATSSGRLLLCANVHDEDTVGLVAKGGFCISGSAVALENALKRYKKLKAMVDRGDLDSAELDREIEANTAISPESVDIAVDNLLELAYSSEGRAEAKELTPEERSALSMRAVLESSVLLKNEDDILPLSQGTRVAFIGDIALSENSEGHGVINACARYCEERGVSCIGSARGYSFTDETDDSLANEALELSKYADVVVLFLGNGHEREKKLQKLERLTIPANQLYLLDKLSKLDKRVVAVLASGHAPDVECTLPFSGVLMSPLRVACSGEAVAKLLLGEYNPSGKLAYTLYSGSQTGLAKQRVYRKKWNMKAGPFVGYRYYDTAGMRVGYPFGYGLSYTQFEYSSLKVENMLASVTVKNIGSVKGRETVQLYVGKDSSAVLRPKKELAAFASVELMPGEAKTVKLPFTFPEVYEGEGFKTERGKYTVYACSSVSDERLSLTVVADGETLTPDNERLSDYLQTVTNIIEDNYTLEADYEPMKKSVKNILFGAGSVALAVSLAIFNSLTATSSVFLGIVAGILAAAAIVFFAIEIVERNREYARKRAEVEEKNRENFEEAEKLDGLSSARMFVDEFDAPEDESSLASAFTDDSIAEEYLTYVDKEFTFADAVGEFSVFAEERGCKFAPGVVENIFASLATSRLLVVEGMKSLDFQSFVLLLAEYFDTTAYIDVVNNTYLNENNAFFGTNESGELVRKNAVFAMEAAKGSRMNIHFSALDGVRCDGVMDYFAPFARYIKNPNASSVINAPNGTGGEVSFSVPGNLWIVFNLASGEHSTALPDSLSKLAATVKIDCVNCPVSREHELVRKFRYYQLDYLTERVGAASTASEQVWKKIDKLEDYANKISGYRIGNKLWLMFERQVAVLTASGVELSDAIDRALAVKLLPSIITAIDGKLKEDDRSLAETLDMIFGEENISVCREKLKAYGLA